MPLGVEALGITALFTVLALGLLFAFFAGTALTPPDPFTQLVVLPITLLVTLPLAYLALFAVGRAKPDTA